LEARGQRWDRVKSQLDLNERGLRRRLNVSEVTSAGSLMSVVARLCCSWQIEHSDVRVRDEKRWQLPRRASSLPFVCVSCRNLLCAKSRANVVMVSELKGTAPRNGGEQKCADHAREQREPVILVCIDSHIGE
jgi:hypothetical protein